MYAKENFRKTQVEVEVPKGNFHYTRNSSKDIWQILGEKDVI